MLLCFFSDFHHTHSLKRKSFSPYISTYTSSNELNLSQLIATICLAYTKNNNNKPPRTRRHTFFSIFFRFFVHLCCHLCSHLLHTYVVALCRQFHANFVFCCFFLIFYICCYLRARHDGPKWIFAPLAQSVRFYCYTFCCCYYCLLLLLLLCLLFVAVVILVYFAKIANYFVQMYINRPPPLNCLLQLCADNSTVVQRCV